MIVECPYCESRVDGRVIGSCEGQGPEDPFPVRATLLKCPACSSALLAVQEHFQTGDDRYQWSAAARAWPLPEHYLALRLPGLVRQPLAEARRCYKAEAYAACAVMCGKVLEAVCSEHGVKPTPLADGLRELRDKQIIDKRIFLWGEALRRHRNIGAHASGQNISGEDAKDLLDFAGAICDYVFVLTSRFDQFMRRKGESVD